MRPRPTMVSSVAVHTAAMVSRRALQQPIVVQAVLIPFYERIHTAAQRLVDDPNSDEFSFVAAIIIAATACETAVDLAITSLAARRGALSAPTLRSVNLIDGKVRRKWNSIAGDQIGREPFWQSYTMHVDRRNDVAHTGRIKGTSVTRSDAEESIVVTRAFLDHITERLS